MQPPWEVEPDKFADKFWIVAKSDYRAAWQTWFSALPAGQQVIYKETHVEPEICDGNFYMLYGEPAYDPRAMAEGFRDEDGMLPPPWIAFPHIGLGSIGWRMGTGEDYWHVFHEWYAGLPDVRKSALKAKYPEPTEVEHGYPWTGFYERKERNG